MDPQGEFLLEPIIILQRRNQEVNNRALVEVLVQWQGVGVEVTTWKLYWQLREKDHHLEGKVL